MKKIFWCLLGLFCLLGARCEENRIANLDEGFMLHNSGNSLKPGPVPTEVVFLPEMENLDSALRAVNDFNAWFPVEMFYSVVDRDRWFYLTKAPTSSRIGTLTVTTGFLGVADWRNDFEFVEYGGLNTLGWNDEYEILFGSIIMNTDYAYSSQWMRDNLIHELGHYFALGHDVDSIDLRSCMSSPPQYNCMITSEDVSLIMREVNDR